MKRSKHSLSHFRLMSCALGQIVPLTWFEVLPGDTIQASCNALIRAAPLVSPPMHPVHIRIHWFFVPNRLMWQGTQTYGSPLADSGFESFITGGPDGLDATVHPYIHVTSAFSASTLADYLGLPSTYGGTPYNISALPFRGYNIIYNEYYRDQDLVTPLVVSTADGADTTTSLNIQNCYWQKDYFTTARPWESKGPAVGIFSPGAQANIILATGGTATTHPAYPGVPAQAANSISSPATGFDSTTDTTVAGTRWYADLTNAGAVDINNLRHQFAIQRYQEARARFGSRYVEYLRYLGIRSSDARMQRPEYLGGGTSTIQFSEVLQTGVTTSGTQSGVGQMFGHGITAQRTNRWRRFFEEHGIVYCLLSARPITVYSQQIERAWLRGMTSAGGATAPAGLTGTKEDYYQRELENIGQMQINGMEVDQQIVPGTAFGFQDRYDEYRRKESHVAGQFRSNLNTWHFARTFASAPSLNSTFVQCVPSLLPFADQAHDQLYIMANHSIQARRMLRRSGGNSYVR